MKTYLNTPAIYAQSASKVDRENGIISNVVVTAMGEAKGHNIHLNSKFLDDVVTLAAEHKQGIKARFGHPNICATALGTYLGRYKNYRRIGDSVLADLHLDQSAKSSPNGNLYSYVLDMAENNPDMFGASIAFKQGESIKEFSEVNGKKIERSYATIKALYATDLVDSPATTDGLFEAFHQDDFASQVTLFLDDHPQVFELLDKKPQILEEFLNNYKHYKSNKTMNLSDEITNLKNWITENFKAKNPEELSEQHQAIFDTLKSDFELKLSELPNQDTQLSELTEKIKTISSTNSNLSADNLKLTDELKDLKTNLSDLNTVKDTLESNISELQSKFDTMESDFNKLQATKTAKTNVTDPNVTLASSENDIPKNSILNDMPTQLKRKLKKL